MASAMLNIRVVQPRMLSKKQAADYLGLPETKFVAICPVLPVEISGKVIVYDIRDLDLWIDHKKAGYADPDDALLSLLDKK